MNVYVGHPKAIDYQGELYPAIKNSVLVEKANVILPHENSEESFESKQFLKTCDLMIAEVSEAATGLGIELGWADIFEVPILLVYKKGKKISRSIQVISNNFICYENGDDLTEQLNHVILKNILN